MPIAQRHHGPSSRYLLAINPVTNGGGMCRVNQFWTSMSTRAPARARIHTGRPNRNSSPPGARYSGPSWTTRKRHPDCSYSPRGRTGSARAACHDRIRRPRARRRRRRAPARRGARRAHDDRRRGPARSISPPRARAPRAPSRAAGSARSSSRPRRSAQPACARGRRSRATRTPRVRVEVLERMSVAAWRGGPPRSPGAPLSPIRARYASRSNTVGDCTAKPPQ